MLKQYGEVYILRDKNTGEVHSDTCPEDYDKKTPVVFLNSDSARQEKSEMFAPEDWVLETISIWRKD